MERKQSRADQARPSELLTLNELDYSKNGHQVTQKVESLDSRSTIDYAQLKAEITDSAERIASINETSEAETSVLDDPTLRTDFGNAARFYRQHGDRTRYVYERKMFYSFDGRIWRDNQSIVERRAKATVKSIFREVEQATNDDQKKRLFNHWMASQKPERINGLLNTVRSEIVAEVADFDSHPDLFNCQNGTIELETGEIRPHDPGDLLTKITPVRHDPQAICPKWEKFLFEIFAGEMAVIEYLQRAVGYSLSGDVREQVFFLLYGTGSNGKSLLLTILRKLAGDYHSHAQMSAFTTRPQNNGAPTEEIARLRGARLVTATETEESKRLSEGLIKQITGGDPVTACFKYERYFTFIPTFKLWIAANHKPKINGTDQGIWRRPQLIPFNVRFEKDPEKAAQNNQPIADLTLESKLIAELPGILNWALKGYRLWREQGLRPPKMVSAAIDAYRTEMDTLGSFLEEHCVENQNARVGTSELYKVYKEWAERSGEYIVSQTIFSQKIAERGFTKRQNSRGSMVFLGLGLCQMTT